MLTQFFFTKVDAQNYQKDRRAKSSKSGKWWKLILWITSPKLFRNWFCKWLSLRNYIFRNYCFLYVLILKKKWFLCFCSQKFHFQHLLSARHHFLTKRRKSPSTQRKEVPGGHSCKETWPSYFRWEINTWVGGSPYEGKIFQIWKQLEDTRWAFSITQSKSSIIKELNAVHIWRWRPRCCILFYNSSYKRVS